MNLVMICKDHWDNKTHADNGVIKNHYENYIGIADNDFLYKTVQQFADNE